MSPARRPVLWFAVLWLGLAAALAVALARAAPGLHPAADWLGAITAAAFLAFGYDKLVSGSRFTRVPERVLLLLVAVGGTVGGLVGMQLLRHKSVKGSFQTRFWLVVAVQLAAGVGWYLLRRDDGA